MATRFGLTWWGQRWIGALEAMGARYANRLPRGRTYARKGYVLDLTVAHGEVTARVEGSRPRPYRVTLRIPVFREAEWALITTALAGQLRHSAALLDGRMPEDIDDVLAGCGLSLFPRDGELETSCSCPDAVNPCKHVAAVHYTLAQTFDADPFLLPQLRGRDRDGLLAGLRAHRVGDAAAPPSANRRAAGDGVSLAELSPGSLFQARGDLTAIVVHPQPPEDPAATLRSLGPPPGELVSTSGALTAAVERAASHAWRLAAGEDESSSDDPLLAELRASGSATSRELADRLGWTIGAVRAGLAGLVDAGLAHRTGHARSTRYHA